MHITRNFYTESFYTRQAFTHCILLHKRNFFTQKVYKHRSFNTQNTFPLRSFYTQKTLTQKSFYTEKLLHAASFYTDKPSETGEFTNGSFYAEKLFHRGFLTHKKLLRKKPLMHNFCAGHFPARLYLQSSRKARCSTTL